MTKPNIKPYYQSDLVALDNARCQDVFPLITHPIGLVLTDPPYSEHAHDRVASATINSMGKITKKPKKTITYDSLTFDEIREIFASFAQKCHGWLVATMDYRHAMPLENFPPAGWKFIRLGVWVKHKILPQLSGDRPALGWEAVAVLHRDRVRPAWNGGGKAATWTDNSVARASYPGEKPLSLVRSFVSMFYMDGLVFDPFCGSGTTLVACAERGVPCVGCDTSLQACEIAANRLRAVDSQQVFAR